MAVGLHHVSGPTLVELHRRMEAVHAAQFRASLAQNLGEEARTQVANGFRGERDPYGKPWAPLKSRQGKILRKTGRMAASVAVAQVGAGFQLEITAEYAAHHQYGTRRGLPQRQMVPMAETGGLGSIWAAAFDKVTTKMLGEAFGKR